MEGCTVHQWRCSATAHIFAGELESQHTSAESPRRDLDLKTVFVPLRHARGLKGSLNLHLKEGATPRGNCYRCARIGCLHIFENGLGPYICFLRLPCVKIGCQLSISTDGRGETSAPPLSLSQGGRNIKSKRSNSNGDTIIYTKASLCC